jgi:hypothetical protein
MILFWIWTFFEKSDQDLDPDKNRQDQQHNISEQYYMQHKPDFGTNL